LCSRSNPCILSLNTSGWLSLRLNVLQSVPLVDKNTLKNERLESLTGYTDYGGYENRNAYVLIIINSQAK